jgi:hypothetical protein
MLPFSFKNLGLYYNLIQFDLNPFLSNSFFIHHDIHPLMEHLSLSIFYNPYTFFQSFVTFFITYHFKLSIPSLFPYSHALHPCFSGAASHDKQYILSAGRGEHLFSPLVNSILQTIGFCFFFSHSLLPMLIGEHMFI